MKKLMALLCLGILASAVLVGCKGEENAPADPGTSTTTPAEPSKGDTTGG